MLSSRSAADVWACRITTGFDLELDNGLGNASLSLGADFRPPWGGWKTILEDTSFEVRTTDAHTTAVKFRDEFSLRLSSRIVELADALSKELSKGLHRRDLLDLNALGSVNRMFFLHNNTGVRITATQRPFTTDHKPMDIPDGRVTLLALFPSVFSIQIEGMSPPFDVSTAAVTTTRRELYRNDAPSTTPTHLFVGFVTRGESKILTLSSGLSIRNDSRSSIWIDAKSLSGPKHLRAGAVELFPLALVASVAVNEVQVFLSLDGDRWSHELLSVASVRSRGGDLIQVDKFHAVKVMLCRSDEALSVLSLTAPLVIQNRLPNELQIQTGKEVHSP